MSGTVLSGTVKTAGFPHFFTVPFSAVRRA
jgi:hypothetical protein